MIKSMTGFGKAICEYNNRKYSIELKSLNSKQSDVFVRVPIFFKEKEITLRNFISSQLLRGKIEFSIRIESDSNEKISEINQQLFNSYLVQLKKMSNSAALLIDDNNIFRTIMRMPDILKIVTEEFDEKEWETVFEKIKLAVKAVDEFRIQEGEAIGKDILQRIETISILLNQIPNYEEDRINRIKQRLLKNLSEFKTVENIDENRLEQELIYYLEKLDITEEKVRLENHLKYFVSTANEIESVGKKLGFISQEIGREINTIGSKASHSEIQKIVVQMKDELEKIKEQLMNVL